MYAIRSYYGSQYLKKMGGVILIASVLLWALGYFPRTVTSPTQGSGREAAALLSKPVPLSTSSKVQPGTHLNDSYLGRLGKFIQPALSPLGFDWKMGVSLISGIAAKEIVVSTLAVLYQIDDEETEQDNHLAVKIQEDTYTSGTLEGSRVFNPLSTLSFLLFVLIRNNFV